ncbi:MAG: sugar transferase [bacterium]
MQVPAGATTNSRSVGDNGKQESRGWVDGDGSIRISGAAALKARSSAVVSGLSRRCKDLYSDMFVSPLFLAAMVSIILFIPKRLLKYNRNLLARGFRFARRVMKRGLDVFGALMGLLLSSLILLFLPILIKLDSHGSVLFKQKRIGKNRRKRDRRVVTVEIPYERRSKARRQDDLLGKPFMVYKFRSMRQDAEKKTGPVWASSDDPRITRIGRVLRPYHIDEIPQFVNVLLGEMSLVGPRPERPEFVSKLKKKIPDYQKRFKSKPGLTGLAQLNCGYDTTTEDVTQKLKFDLQYINNKQFMTDVRILWDTVLKIATNYHAKLDEGKKTGASEQHIQ